jgi:hypothetical protein
MSILQHLISPRILRQRRFRPCLAYLGDIWRLKDIPVHVQRGNKREVDVKLKENNIQWIGPPISQIHSDGHIDLTPVYASSCDFGLVEYGGPLSSGQKRFVDCHGRSTLLEFYEFIERCRRWSHYESTNEAFFVL